MIQIGFTGTRKGMSKRQSSLLEVILIRFGPLVLHHGDCIGADEEAHYLALEIGVCKIVVHPPKIATAAAHCGLDPSGLLMPHAGARNTRVVRLAPEDYLVRNRAIAKQTKFLIATPKSDQEERRSGTWATVRYARGCNKPILILGR